MSVAFPSRVMQSFVETLSANLGQDTLSAVLEKASLPKSWADASYYASLDNARAAQSYSELQAALRAYYGRGARGILLRIGGKLWERLLADAPLFIKAQTAVVRKLPLNMRRKSALEALARMIGVNPGDITVHTLDLDLLFVDHASPTALRHAGDSAICFVTLGLVRECLYWAVGVEHDIEETSCRALGAKQCEFKITVGG